MLDEAVVKSNKRSKDRESQHQRWADRQEVTADVLREAVEAAGARAAEISRWLDASSPPREAEAGGGLTPAPPIRRSIEPTGPPAAPDAAPNHGPDAERPARSDAGSESAVGSKPRG